MKKILKFLFELKNNLFDLYIVSLTTSMFIRGENIFKVLIIMIILLAISVYGENKVSQKSKN